MVTDAHVFRLLLEGNLLGALVDGGGRLLATEGVTVRRHGCLLTIFFQHLCHRYSRLKLIDYFLRLITIKFYWIVTVKYS